MKAKFPSNLETLDQHNSRTKNLVKEYSPERFAEDKEQKKDYGAADGRILKSQSKTYPNKTKKWLNKGTIVEASINKVKNFSSCFTYEFVEAEKCLVSRMYKAKQSFTRFETQIDAFLEAQGKFQKMRSKKKEIDDDLKAAYEAMRAALEEVSSITNSIILIEKFSEVLAGEVNRLISGRDETPKSRILHDSTTDSISFMSKIAENSQNLQDFLGKKITADNEQNIQKPIKGLFSAILTRLFLSDDDIKFDNLLVVETADCYQIENIDFGKSFSPIIYFNIHEELNAPNLLKAIQEFSVNKSHINIHAYNYLLDKSDHEEIATTLKTIANLKDEDLQAIVDKLADIKSNNGRELISAEIRTQYLEILKTNRKDFSDVYESYKNTLVENKGEPVKANFSPVARVYSRSLSAKSSPSSRGFSSASSPSAGMISPIFASFRHSRTESNPANFSLEESPPTDLDTAKSNSSFSGGFSILSIMTTKLSDPKSRRPSVVIEESLSKSWDETNREDSRSIGGLASVSLNRDLSNASQQSDPSLSPNLAPMESVSLSPRASVDIAKIPSTTAKAFFLEPIKRERSHSNC